MPWTGLVTKFDAERGFGFLRAPGEERDVFVHVSEVEGGAPLAIGDQVHFEMEQTPKGPRAVRVTAVRVGRSAAAIFIMLGGALAFVAGVALDRIASPPWYVTYLAAVNAATLALMGYNRGVRGRGLISVPRLVLRVFTWAGGAPVALIVRKLLREPA